MSLRIIYVEANAAAPADSGLLARISHKPTKASEPKVWQLPLNALETASKDELWCVSGDIKKTHDTLKHGTLDCHQGDGFSALWLQLDIAQFSDFKAASEYAWQQVLASIQAPDQHLLKVWHYLPAINSGAGDNENYRQFCSGRANALITAGWEGELPAATAIGIPEAEAPLVMYWLLGKQAGSNLENPRQISAWDYPREYGPASPNFSRATLEKSSRVLLISGTASVVGHTTSHPYKTAAQTDEMLVNLEHLLASNQLQKVFRDNELHLRVYIRDPQNWETIQQRLVFAGLKAEHLVPLHGEICRQDLTVELDGFSLPV